MAKQVVARIGDELHRAVKAKAATEGKTITAVVKELLEAWIRDDAARASADRRRGPRGGHDEEAQG